MSLWRQALGGLRVLLRREAADRDLDAEIADYVARATQANVAAGMTPEQARRAARLESGPPVTAREAVRDEGWERLAANVLRDLRFALRQLRAQPGFAVTCVLTLALGIGATTAIFSAVYPVLIEPLPYPGGGRIVALWYSNGAGGRSSMAFGTFRELAARCRSFEALAAWRVWRPTITTAAEPALLEGERVSASYFAVFGTAPALGPGFDSTDDRPGGRDVVVVSDALWRRRLQAAGNVVGRTITLDGVPFTVEGVMPAGFRDVQNPSAEVWSLLQYDPSLPPQGREWGMHLGVVGRIRSGVALADERRDLAVIAGNPVPEFARAPWTSMKDGITTDRLRDSVARDVRPALLAVVGAVLLLLLIACVNVTNLVLARAARRRGEFAMRVALGASRGRLASQLIAESLVLALLGGVLGAFVADAGVRVLMALAPSGMPGAGAIGVHGVALGFAFVVSATIGVVVGLVPVSRSGNADLHSDLQAASQRAAGGRHRTRAVLVVAEVALAVVLLTGAGLLLRSLDRLFARPAGFDADGAVVMQVQIASRQRYHGDSAVNSYYDRVLTAVRAVPGVTDAAFTSLLPLSGDARDAYGGEFADVPDPAARYPAYRYAVTQDYFATMRIRLLRGRLLTVADLGTTAARPVLISESLARLVFHDADPVGRRLRFGGADGRPWDVVAGVVGDVEQASLADDAEAFYVLSSAWLWADSPRWLVARTTGDPAALAAKIRAAVWSVDPGQPVVRMQTLRDVVATSETRRHFTLVVFEAFALAALALAAIGLYGVISGSVAERTREFGVRAALGASPRGIVGMVLRQGMALSAVGIASGLVAAVMASRFLSSLLYGITRLDPVTYAAVTLLLGAVAALACWLPARRVTGIDPLITLRGE